VLERHLARALEAAGIGGWVRELRFAPPRMWRIDFAWPDAMLAVEIQGGIYRGGGHTSAKGMRADIEKSRALMFGGWRLLLFHGDEIRSGLATEIIRQALEVMG